MSAGRLQNGETHYMNHVEMFIIISGKAQINWLLDDAYGDAFEMLYCNSYELSVELFLL